MGRPGLAAPSLERPTAQSSQQAKSMLSGGAACTAVAKSPVAAASTPSVLAGTYPMPKS